MRSRSIRTGYGDQPTARGQAGRERGFSLVEVMVATAVTGLIFTAAFQLFIEDWKTYKSQTNVSEMRQNARNAMEMLSRDLLVAGYGLRDAQPTVPAILPNQPQILDVFTTDSVTVLANLNDIKSGLSAAMPQPSSEIKLVESAGFIEGEAALIWDATGTWDWFRITAVQNSDHLQHNLDPLSKAYDPLEDTQVVLMDEISYRHDAVNLRLERMLNRGPWLTVAENVEQLFLRYWDETGVELFPVTDHDRRAIRRISITLRVRTARPDFTRRPVAFRTYTVRSDVTPRNMDSLPTM